MDVNNEKKVILEGLDKICSKVSDLSLFIQISNLDPSFEGINKLEETQYHIQDAISELENFFLK